MNRFAGSYIVRCWHVDHDTWRIEISCVHDGSRTVVRTFEEALIELQTRAGASAPGNAPARTP